MLRVFLWMVVIIGAVHVPIGLGYAIATDSAQTTLAVDRLQYAFTSLVVGAFVALAALGLLYREPLLDALTNIIRPRRSP